MPGPEIIDEAAFAQLLDSVGGDADFLSELLETYLASTPELFASMRQAVAAGDAPGLQRAAHSLKSASASFGALAFAAQCKELEDMGRAGALQGGEERIAAAEAAYGDLAAALQSRVGRAS